MSDSYLGGTRSLSSSSGDSRADSSCSNAVSLRRSGKWSEDEVLYAEQLITDFENGTLSDCEDGTTLRAYLSKKLNCYPMRISKTFAGKSIGKYVFSKNLSRNKLRRIEKMMMETSPESSQKMMIETSPESSQLTAAESKPQNTISGCSTFPLNISQPQVYNALNYPTVIPMEGIATVSPSYVSHPQNISTAYYSTNLNITNPEYARIHSSSYSRAVVSPRDHQQYQHQYHQGYLPPPMATHVAHHPSPQPSSPPPSFSRIEHPPPHIFDPEDTPENAHLFYNVIEPVSEHENENEGVVYESIPVQQSERDTYYDSMSGKMSGVTTNSSSSSRNSSAKYSQSEKRGRTESRDDMEICGSTTDAEQELMSSSSEQDGIQEAVIWKNVMDYYKLR